MKIVTFGLCFLALALSFLQGSTISLVSYSLRSEEEKSWTELTKINQQAYADKHGYNFYYCQDPSIAETLADYGWPISWAKFTVIAHLISLKNTECEWVAWIDDDAFITNDTLCLESIIATYGDNKDIIIGKDVDEEKFMCNTGVMLIRCTDTARNILEKMWDIAEQHDWQQSQYALQALYVQDPLIQDRIAIVAPGVLQTFLLEPEWRWYQFSFTRRVCYEWKEGDFILHLTGCSRAVSPGRMRWLVDQFGHVIDQRDKDKHEVIFTPERLYDLFDHFFSGEDNTHFAGELFKLDLRNLMPSIRENYMKFFMQHKDDHALYMIPKIIHQIWLGPKELPDQAAMLKQRWQQLHPSWEYKLWREEDVAENFPCGLINQEIFDKALREKNYGKASDILRCEILYAQGGVYTDFDVIPYRSLDYLHKACNFYASIEDFGAYYWVAINNGVLGASPAHPILQACNAIIAERVDQSPCVGEDFVKFFPIVQGKLLETIWKTGPLALLRAVNENLMHDETINMVFPETYFIAQRECSPFGACRHFFHGSWG